jgi:hypothetical protein
MRGAFRAEYRHVARVFAGRMRPDHDQNGMGLHDLSPAPATGVDVGSRGPLKHPD